MGGLRRILLYGDSIVLGSVGARLGRDSQFELIRLPAARPSAAQLRAFQPDVNLVRLWTGRQYRELSADALATLIAGGPGQEPKQMGKEGAS